MENKKGIIYFRIFIIILGLYAGYIGQPLFTLFFVGLNIYCWMNPNKDKEYIEETKEVHHHYNLDKYIEGHETLKDLNSNTERTRSFKIVQ